MHFLRNSKIGYEEAIRTTLLKGGDSDTNACIVGGLVACYHPIPAYMWKPVLNFDCTVEEHKRPALYSLKKYVAVKPPL
jgi:ADP-ribosylglycohydrolase